MQFGDPHRHHADKLAARQVRQSQLEATDGRLSWTRLVLFVVLVGLAWMAFWRQAVSAWWLLAPAAAFLVLMRVHDNVIRAHEAATRAVRWYERGIARLEDRWAGSGDSGDRFLDDDHPYSRDLDLFGSGSLFQLLDTAQTTTGEETLARWLLTPAPPSVLRARQVAVEELSTRPQLMEDLYTLGEDARQTVASASLLRWARAPSALDRPWIQIGPPLLSSWLVASTALWGFGMLPGAVPILALLVNLMAGLIGLRSASRVLHGSSEPARELIILAAVLSRLGEETYESERLRHLHTTLRSEQSDPVAATKHLDWFIQMHDWQHNLFFAPIAASLLWGLQCAAAVERWRRRYGGSIEQWLSVVGEFEALGSFATYRFEHRQHPFPEIVGETPTTPPVYEARQIAHPLLPVGAVANDVHLGETPQLIVVSGSNMSGKTTLLRTVGVNAVMALAGAPVRAEGLRISPVAIGGTLRVQDSLLAGRSKFYAEVLRVKQLVEIARGPLPLLFLMDELFHGTNSHDRVEGAHGVLAFLVKLGAVGMVTTHDLALAAIGDRLGRQGLNVHFEDQMVGNELAFDYRLRTGQARHTNALALMRAVGLEVESAGDVHASGMSETGPPPESSAR